jgi:choline dehydrogenase-like flavoprotein
MGSRTYERLGFFASEARDPAWNHESILQIYRRIEDWHGAPDPKYRGSGGPVFVAPSTNPNPLAPATVEAARSVGIPTFENPNGRMMEADGGASIQDRSPMITHGAMVFADLRELDIAASKIPVQGARYPEALQKMVGR